MRFYTDSVENLVEKPAELPDRNAPFLAFQRFAQSWCIDHPKVPPEKRANYSRGPSGARPWGHAQPHHGQSRLSPSRRWRVRRALWPEQELNALLGVVFLQSDARHTNLRHDVRVANAVSGPHEMQLMAV